MQKFHEMQRALGEPTTLRVVGDPAMSAVVARWQHGDVSIRGAAHDAAQIVLSLSGGQSVKQRFDGRMAQSRAAVGSVCVLPPGEPTITDIQGSSDALHIFVPTSMLEVIRGRPMPRIERFFDSADPDIRRGVLEILVTLRHHEPDIDLKLEGSIFHLAQVLAKEPGAGPQSPAKGGLAPAAKRRVDDLIASRIDDGAAPLKLGDMAEAAGLSVDHFTRMFRKDTGTTPYLYASRRRLERAMTLLTKPAASVGDVADRTGFCSPSHLVAAFRRHLGVTPASFRDAVRN